jgi:hypothetical protein
VSQNEEGREVNSPEHRLDGWKEIANHLRKSTRTAQRWERELGLPVRRLKTLKGEIVFALKQELDVWQLQNSAAREDLSSNGDEDIDVSDGVSESPGEVAIPRSVSKRQSRFSFAIWATGFLVAGFALGLLYLHFNHSPVPVTYRIEHNALIVLNKSGDELWRRNFEDLEPGFYSGKLRSIWIGDLNQDGQTEVLFVEQPTQALTHSVTMHCISQKGRELWSFTPSRIVRTASEEFEAIYGIIDFEVFDTAAGKRIALTANHHLYFPEEVVLLSPTGTVVGEYWHPGHFSQVRALDLKRDGNIKLFLSGVNNEYRTATLVVLDLDKVSGAATQTNPNYQFPDMPPAKETVRVYFPRSCINKLLNRFNVARGVEIRPNSLLVHVDEQPGVAAPAALMYEMSFDMTKAKLSVVDYFRVVHKELEADHRLDHKLTDEELKSLEGQVRVNAPPPVAN